MPELKPQGKEPKTPGPEPEILKIDMEWKEAIKKFIGETEANGWLAKIAHSTPPKLAAFMCIPPLRKVHTSEKKQAGLGGRRYSFMHCGSAKPVDN
ncbi:MAG: hypothetical protein ABSD44_00750 [Terracidiphilus sp.]